MDVRYTTHQGYRETPHQKNDILLQAVLAAKARRINKGNADLAMAVAKRYWEDHAAALETILTHSSNPIGALRRYPETFRWALENENRMCLSGFMAAEYDDLSEPVKKEVQTFADINVAWLSRTLSAAKVASSKKSEARAKAIFAAVAGE